MARTNIEETAWANFYKLASLINEHPNMVAGTVAGLWHESQEKLQTAGTREDILLWAGLMLEAKEKQEKWINGLVVIGFLSPTDSGFSIAGNEIEIDVRVQRMTAGSKGAESTKKKWADKKARAVRPGNTTPLGLAKPEFARPNAMQSNAIQINKKAPAAPDLDFEALYAEYPCKKGKAEGMLRLRKMKLTQEIYSLILKAIKEYKRVCVFERTDPKYMKHFSTFIGTAEKETWRDYLPTDKPEIRTTLAVVESNPYAEDVPELSDEERKESAQRLREQLNKVGLKTGQVV